MPTCRMLPLECAGVQNTKSWRLRAPCDPFTDLRMVYLPGLPKGKHDGVETLGPSTGTESPSVAGAVR